MKKYFYWSFMILSIIFIIFFGKFDKNVKMNGIVKSHTAVRGGAGGVLYSTLVFADDGKIDEVFGTEIYLLKEGTLITYTATR